VSRDPEDASAVPPSAGIAERIAAGHAFDKHVVQLGEYPDVTSPTEFAILIEQVLTNPEATRALQHGRRAY